MIFTELYDHEARNDATESIYDMRSLDVFVDDDMISGAEEGFMAGYLETDESYLTKRDARQW